VLLLRVAQAGLCADGIVGHTTGMQSTKARRVSREDGDGMGVSFVLVVRRSTALAAVDQRQDDFRIPRV
jgi:hypothetical protein